MKLAFEVQGITPTETLVLVALGNFADEDWTCWPGKARLIHMTKLSARGLNLTLKKLEAAGLLAIEARHRDNGSQRSNRYVLFLGEGVTTVPLPGTSLPLPRRHVSPEGKPGAPLEPSLNDQKKESVLRASDPFEDWWKLYPRKVDKAEARKSFWKAASKVSFERLCEATVRFAEEVKDRPRDKIPHPTTWLNHERWEDEAGENRSQTDDRRERADPRGGPSDARLQAMVEGHGIALAIRRDRRRWSV